MPSITGFLMDKFRSESVDRHSATFQRPSFVSARTIEKLNLFRMRRANYLVRGEYADPGLF